MLRTPDGGAMSEFKKKIFSFNSLFVVLPLGGVACLVLAAYESEAPAPALPAERGFNMPISRAARVPATVTPPEVRAAGSPSASDPARSFPQAGKDKGSGTVFSRLLGKGERFSGIDSTGQEASAPVAAATSGQDVHADAVVPAGDPSADARAAVDAASRRLADLPGSAGSSGPAAGGSVPSAVSIFAKRPADSAAANRVNAGAHAAASAAALQGQAALTAKRGGALTGRSAGMDGQEFQADGAESPSSGASGGVIAAENAASRGSGAGMQTQGPTARAPSGSGAPVASGGGGGGGGGGGAGTSPSAVSTTDQPKNPPPNQPKTLSKAKARELLKTATTLEERHVAAVLRPAVTSEKNALTAFLPKMKAGYAELDAMKKYIVDDMVLWGNCRAGAYCSYSKRLRDDMAQFRETSKDFGFDALVKKSADLTAAGHKAVAAFPKDVRKVDTVAAFNESAAPTLLARDTLIPGITSAHDTLYAPNAAYESKPPLIYYALKIHPACPGYITKVRGVYPSAPACVVMRRIATRGHQVAAFYSGSYQTRLTGASNALAKPAWPLMSAADKAVVRKVHAAAKTERQEVEAFRKRVETALAGADDPNAIVSATQDLLKLIDSAEVPSLAAIEDAKATDDRKTKGLLDAATSAVGAERGFQGLIERLRNAAK